MTYNPADPIVIRPLKIDFEDFMFIVVMTTVIFLALTTIVFWFVHQRKWAHTAPPKTITINHTIHDNGLTTAQNEFIKQCEKTWYDPNPQDNHSVETGVPNVEVQPWTCTLPKP